MPQKSKTKPKTASQGTKKKISWPPAVFIDNFLLPTFVQGLKEKTSECKLKSAVRVSEEIFLLG